MIFNKFNAFPENLAEKVHNLGADALRVMLTLTAPLAANAVRADLTEVAAGNGYTSGGAAVTITTSAQTGGMYRLVGNDVVFTAGGGAIADFRYLVLYNDTPTSPADPLIGYWDNGSTVSLADGQVYTLELGATNDILRLS